MGDVADFLPRIARFGLLDGDTARAMTRVMQAVDDVAGVADRVPASDLQAWLSAMRSKKTSQFLSGMMYELEVAHKLAKTYPSDTMRIMAKVPNNNRRTFDVVIGGRIFEVKFGVGNYEAQDRAVKQFIAYKESGVVSISYVVPTERIQLETETLLTRNGERAYKYPGLAEIPAAIERIGVIESTWK